MQAIMGCVLPKSAVLVVVNLCMSSGKAEKIEFEKILKRRVVETDKIVF